MFITGPQVIKQVTRENVSAEELGGAEAHMHYSGNIHFIAEYDKLGRLTKKTYPPDANDHQDTETFTYDANGNRRVTCVIVAHRVTSPL